MKTPLVSVIIPTKNSADTLEACLKSIKNQTYQNIETIIVDQSSTDDTTKIAKRYGAKIVSLPPPKFYSPPTKSRNTGAQESKGEILYHIDSDMELSPKLIEEIVHRFEKNKHTIALVIHEEDQTRGFWSRCKALERRCYWGNDNIESARAVRREIFEKVHGYDEKINSGEDFDIHRRYKKEGGIEFCENVIYHNLGTLNFQKTLSKKFNYGRTGSAYFEKQQTSGQSIVLEQVKCYLKNYKIFLQDPIHGIGMLFLRACELAIGVIGIQSAKFQKRAA